MATEKAARARPCSRSGRGVLVALTIVLPACVSPTWQGYTSVMNDRLRPDREPLEGDQLTQALNVGPYSTHLQADQLVSEIYPAMPDVEKLPVADCLWIANGVNGRDMLRLHWEAIARLDPQGDIAQTVRPEDRDPELRLGMCRMNDPVDRVPPRGVDSMTDYFEPASFTEYLSEPPLITASARANWPRHTTDLVILAGRLQEERVPVPQFGQCPSAAAQPPDPPRAITSLPDADRGVSFFNGPSDETGRVSVCTPIEGYEVSPDGDGVRYRVFADPEDTPDQNQNPPRTLGPTIMVASGPRFIARPTTRPAAGVLVWSTPSVGGTAGVRWQENFTSSLLVDSVRFFRLAGGVITYLAPGDDLCIGDPHGGQADCRWHCRGHQDPTGARIYSLLGPDAQCTNESGTPETALVTPAYAPSSLAQGPLTTPLSWRVESGLPGDIWIEFKLVSSFIPAALRADPALTDLGATRRTTLRQGSFEVRNVGGHPMRIESVSLVPGWGAPGDFSVSLPAKPQGIPIPLDFTSDGQGGLRMETGAGWSELAQLIDVRESSRHVTHRSASRDGYRFAHAGEGVTLQGGIAFLDNPAARIKTILAAGTLRPLRKMAYARRAVPFEVLSGVSFPVLVSARPNALGDRLAKVRVTGHSLIDGSVAQLDAQVKIVGLQGPLADVAPSSLGYPLLTASPDRRWTRNLAVLNSGDQPLTVTAVSIDGGLVPTPGSFTITSGNESGFVLAPGIEDLVEVQHAPFCSPSGMTLASAAVLTVKTTSGDRTVPLVGTSSTCTP